MPVNIEVVLVAHIDGMAYTLFWSPVKCQVVNKF